MAKGLTLGIAAGLVLGGVFATTMTPAGAQPALEMQTRFDEREPVLVDEARPGGVRAVLDVSGVGRFEFDGGSITTELDIRRGDVRGERREKAASRVARYSVVLRRDLAPGQAALEGWLNDVTEQGVGRDCVLTFLTPEGAALRRYEILGAYPASLSINDRGGVENDEVESGARWGEEVRLVVDSIGRTD